jgi:hypothetical protein
MAKTKKQPTLPTLTEEEKELVRTLCPFTSIPNIKKRIHRSYATIAAFMESENLKPVNPNRDQPKEYNPVGYWFDEHAMKDWLIT